MTTRSREFIGAAAGAVFVGCDVLNARHVHAQGAPARRNVVVNGRRVPTVDVHAHCAFPEAMALMGVKLEPQNLVIADDRIRAMDAQGVDIEALSINPYWYKADRDVAQAVIKMQNEKLAELCAAQPDRFVAFATMALQHPDLAVAQLEDGVRKLGLRGVSVGAHVEGMELADPKFHPVWAKAEELGCLVFIHPIPTPEFNARLGGNGGLTNTIGNPLDTTIALSHLIFEGTLDRFPGLKIWCKAARAAAISPSYAHLARTPYARRFPIAAPWRSRRNPPNISRCSSITISIMFEPEAMRHLIAEVGIGQIVMGTDYPYHWNQQAVDRILATPGASDAELASMLGGVLCRACWALSRHNDYPRPTALPMIAAASSGALCAGPGDVSVGTNEDEIGLIGGAAVTITVAHGLERDAQCLRRTLEAGHGAVIGAEGEQGKILAQFLEHIAPGRQKLRRQVMAGAGLEGVSAAGAAGTVRRSEHDGRAFVVRLVGKHARCCGISVLGPRALGFGAVAARGCSAFKNSLSRWIPASMKSSAVSLKIGRRSSV